MVELTKDVLLSTLKELGGNNNSEPLKDLVEEHGTGPIVEAMREYDLFWMSNIVSVRPMLEIEREKIKNLHIEIAALYKKLERLKDD